MNSRALAYIIEAIVNYALRAWEKQQKGDVYMITVSIKGVLIGVLLIALIVLVVFLIVMVSNVTDTIKKANAILDGGTAAASSAKAKVDEMGAAARESAAKVSGTAELGVQVAQNLLNKIVK